LVQAPGVFPVDYRVALGDRMYGCDECQEVCPVNLKAERRDPPPPADPDDEPAVDVLAILNATDDELLRRYGRWYIPQREPRYLRRNALIILGNTARPDDPAVHEALRDALDDPDPLIRAHAVWAAARLGCTDLIKLVTSDTDPMVRSELARVPTTPRVV
jgi:epoxyqueuosine reductase